MNRTNSCLAILVLLLMAVAICIKQTFEFRELIENLSIAILVTLEGIAAGVIIASAVSLLRKRYARQKKRINRRPVPEAVRA